MATRRSQGIADLGPLWRPRSRRPGTGTTGPTRRSSPPSLTVLFAPYMIAVAEQAPPAAPTRTRLRRDPQRAGPRPRRRLAALLPHDLRHHLGAFVLPVVGAVVDRSPRKKGLHGAASPGPGRLRGLLFFMQGELAARRRRDRRWQHPGRLLAGGLRRDPGRHLDRGRARPGLVTWLGVRLPRRRPAARRQPRRGDLGHDTLGLSAGMAVRLSLLSAAHVVGRLHAHPVPCGCSDYAAAQRRCRRGRRCSSAASASSATTLKEMRSYPMTLTFLVAYLFYNDGIQTVITPPSIYGAKSSAFARQRADRDDPAGPVRGLRRRVALRPARRPLRRLPAHPVRARRLDGDRRRRALPARRATCRCSSPRRRASAWCWAAPRRCRARSSACSSPAAGRASTSPSTTPASAARRGSAPWSSAWSSSSPAPTGRRSWR